MKIVSRFFVFVAVMIVSAGFVIIPAQAGSQGKKALMIVAKEDFEQNEYKKTREALESGGVICTVASTKIGALKGNKGARVTSDMELADVVVADYDAVVLIGGNGVKKIWKNEDAHRIVREAVEQGKILGAICASPGLLAYADVLNGKKATAHPQSGARPIMEERGCTYTGAAVEVDGKLITANGPAAASEYGEAIVTALN